VKRFLAALFVFTFGILISDSFYTLQFIDFIF